MADKPTITKIDDDVLIGEIEESTDEGSVPVEREYKHRLAGYLLAIGQKKVDIANLLNVSPQYYHRHYDKHPKTLQYRREYEEKLLIEVEADFDRVVKELKSIAFSKVKNISASEKLRALEDLAKLYDKVPASKLEVQGKGGGPIELTAVSNYEELSDEELERRIEERVREIKGSQQ